MSLGNIRINENPRNYETQENHKQAGAELSQAQIKLGLDFSSIFCRFGFARFGLVELVWWISFVGLVEKIWFGIFGSLHFKYFPRQDLVW